MATIEFTRAMNGDAAAQLREPFKPEEIGKLPRIYCGACRQAAAKVCDKHKRVRCDGCRNNNITEAHLHLDYVGHAEVTDRLLQVDPAWCVDDETEALTTEGWVRGIDISTRHTILSMDPATARLVWSPVHEVFRRQRTGPMHRLIGRNIDALVTPGHKFADTLGNLIAVEKLPMSRYIRTMGEAVEDSGETYTDSFVELVGWAVTEGHYVDRQVRSPRATTVSISQRDESANCERIRGALKGSGAHWTERSRRQGGKASAMREFDLTGPVAATVRQVAPDRVMTTDFLLALSASQRELLVDTMIRADGHRPERGRNDPPVFFQRSREAVDAFVMLCALTGRATNARLRTDHERHYGGPVWTVTVKASKTAMVGSLRVREVIEDVEGPVWCPRTDYGTFVCRRSGLVYVTGNTWEPVAFDADGLPKLDSNGGLWIRLTVAGVSRLGYGDAQGKKGTDAVKETIGDAVRNSAMRFGVALDLWGSKFDPPVSVTGEDAEGVGGAITGDQREILADLWGQLGYGGDEQREVRLSVSGRLLGLPGLSLFSALTHEQAEKLIGQLRERLAKNAEEDAKAKAEGRQA